jgi:hypothetical protein
VEFFQKSWRNCQKVWMEKLWNLQEFQCKLHDVDECVPIVRIH